MILKVSTCVVKVEYADVIPTAFKLTYPHGFVTNYLPKIIVIFDA